MDGLVNMLDRRLFRDLRDETLEQWRRMGRSPEGFLGCKYGV